MTRKIEYTANDKICRNFQIEKFDIRKMVPAVIMQNEVEIDNLLKKREAINKDSDIHITIYHQLIKLISDVLANYPLLYSSYYKNRIYPHDSLIINIPVSKDNHVEYVVLRDPDRKDILEIGKDIKNGIEGINKGTNILMNALIDMSKLSKFQKMLYKMRYFKNPIYFLDKYYGYFPVTNFGSFDIKSGATILSEPMIAALVIGKSEKRPVNKEDRIEERTFITMTLSFDHRVMDGSYGGHFLNDLKKEIEEI